MSSEFMWVFSGERIRTSGLFRTRELAESWIKQNQLSGMLTRYPVDIGAYDWAIRENRFSPKNPQQRGSDFIANFSDASFEHYHYENGLTEDEMHDSRR